MEEVNRGERSYHVSEGELQRIEAALRDADYAGDQAIADVLGDRRQGIETFLAYARRKVQLLGARVWMVEQLLDLLDDECQWLAETALALGPVQGTS